MENDKKEKNTITDLRLCPRCFLPMNPDDVMNSLSHDSKSIICNDCGKMESMRGICGTESVYGLEIGQRRAQAAMWGLNKKRDPDLPKIEAGSQQLWYDKEKKIFKLITPQNP